MGPIASQPANHMRRNAEQFCPTSSLINTNTKHQHPYLYTTTNMPHLLPPKLFKVTIFGQMVNMAASLLILVEMTWRAYPSYQDEHQSCLLEHTEPIDNSLLV